MKHKLKWLVRRYRIIGACLLLAAAALPTQAADALKLDLQLIWGTNDPQPDDPKYKPLDETTMKKFGDLPLKWSYYYQVCKKRFEVPDDAQKKVKLDRFEVQVKNLGQSQVEVSLFAKDAPVWKRTQALRPGEVLMLGGNAPNDSAWFVILRRYD